MDSREEVRDELLAILAASRELPPDSDRHLAEAFAERVHGDATARQVRPMPPRRVANGRFRRPRRAVGALILATGALVVGVPVLGVQLTQPAAQARTVCTRDTFFPKLYHSRATVRSMVSRMEAKDTHLALAKEEHIPGYAYSVVVFWDHANCSKQG